MSAYLQQIKAIWAKMETTQRVSMALILAAFIGLVVFVSYGATRPDYRVLATGLTRAQTAEVSAFLDNQGVQHRVEDGETSILVPSKDVYRLRTALAEQDLLDADSKGFKLLDDSSFGMSNHMERRLYDRAVSGELEKSFREIDGVKNARVIISRPQPTPFLRADEEPAISVKLSMRSGRRLSERQLHGVTHLAAAAVEGGNPARVQVMDDKGLISRPDEDPLSMAASTKHELKSVMEKDLITKAQAQLDKMLGPGNSIVSVALDLDFTKRSKATTRVFDPNVLESRTISTSSSTPVPRNGGVSGTQPNVEGQGAQGQADALATETMEDETLKRAGSKENTTVDEEVGRIRGMTVSIVIDQKRSKEAVLDADGNPTDEMKEVVVDYSDAEKAMFEKAVLDAIGYQASRGVQIALDPTSNVDDRFSVTLASMSMYREVEEPAPLAAGVLGTGMDADQLKDWGGWAAAIIVALGLLFVARGQLKRSHAAWAAEQERQRQAEEAAQAAEEAARKAAEEAEGANEMDIRREQLKGNIRQQVQTNPEMASQVIRGWLHE